MQRWYCSADCGASTQLSIQVYRDVQRRLGGLWSVVCQHMCCCIHCWCFTYIASTVSTHCLFGRSVVRLFGCLFVLRADSKKLRSLEKAVERQQQQVEETRSHVLKIQGVCDELRAGENKYGKIMHQMHVQNSQDTKESLAHVTTVEKDVRIGGRGGACGAGLLVVGVWLGCGFVWWSSVFICVVFDLLFSLSVDTVGPANQSGGSDQRDRSARFAIVGNANTRSHHRTAASKCVVCGRSRGGRW